MILVVDNYDSFTYNLVHYLAELGAETKVVRNDDLTAVEALALKPEAILLSPGPCAPDQAGICLALIDTAPADALAFSASSSCEASGWSLPHGRPPIEDRKMSFWRHSTPLGMPVVPEV